jgi:hypothetical protein
VAPTAGNGHEGARAAHEPRNRDQPREIGHS